MTINFTKFYTTIAFFLLYTIQGFALNVTIMESQSFHPSHTMDIHWFNTSVGLGYQTTTENYSFLNDACNLVDTDILVISSGVLNITTLQKENIRDFVKFGGQLYIQGEYLPSHAGNTAFKYLVSELGGDFNWTNQGTGQQVPMYVLEPIKTAYNTVNQLSYFWYGIQGTGDSTIKNFLEYQGNAFGFMFEAADAVTGKIICTSDQDWIRNNSNPLLVENILKHLESLTLPSDLPEITITSAADESCIGEVVTFNAEVLNYHPGVALQWMINGQPVSGATELLFETSDLQDGDVVECVLQLEKLCLTHQHVSNPVLMAIIFPIATPTLDISSVKAEYCKGEVVSMLAALSNPTGLQDINYQWFVNGVPQAGAVQSLYNSSNLQNNDEVTCELSYTTTCDGDITIASQSITLSIVDMVEATATLSASETIICEGNPVTFSILGDHHGDAPTYIWQIDGSPIAETSQEITLNSLTNGQVVSAIVTSNATCVLTTEIPTNSIAIEIIPVITPTAEIIAEQTHICNGEEARFSINGSLLGLNPIFEWAVDGAVTGTNSPQFVSTQLTDGAQVNCRISVSGNCLTTDELNPAPIEMKVNNLVTPNLIIDANTARACEGSAITFTATGENWGLAPVFQWNLNGQAINHDQATLEVEDYEENDVVHLTLISDELCTSHDSVVATAAPVEIKGIQLEVLDVFNEHCNKKDGFIEVSAEGGFAPLNLNWNNGSTTSYLEGLEAGNYELVVTDDIGCTAKIEATVNNEAGPVIMDIETTPAMCEQPTGTAQVTLDEAADYTYFWTFPNGETVESTENTLTAPAGQYDIEIKDAFGCVSSAIFEIAKNSPIVVDLGDDLEIQLGEGIQLNPSVNFAGGITYEWTSSADLPCNDCEKINTTPTDDAVYTVVATNEFGCTATDEVFVNVLPNAEIYIPNVFSPNGDGANDYFTVFGGNNLQSIIKMQIFDRWGNVIFEDTGLTPNAENEGWDGSFKGKQLDQGVYVYVVQLQFIDGKSEIVSGDISIF